MNKTTFNKKIDSVGRIVIPAKLRSQLGLNTGDNVDFFIHQEEDKTYLCMECPNANKSNDELDEAIAALAKLGYKIVKEDWQKHASASGDGLLAEAQPEFPPRTHHTQFFSYF